jgi:probable phosphoglycerate mutase
VAFFVAIMNDIFGIFTIRELFFQKKFSWRIINRMVKKICKNINNSGVEYSAIIGIGRGGAIFASMMSYELMSYNHKFLPIIAFDRQYQDFDGRKKAVPILKNIQFIPQFSEIKDKPVLLVSQKSDPGITINEYRDVLVSSGFTTIDICAVLKSKLTGDTNIKYFYAEYKHSTNIKSFPWFHKQPDIMTGSDFIR